MSGQTSQILLSKLLALKDVLLRQRSREAFQVALAFHTLIGSGKAEPHIGEYFVGGDAQAVSMHNAQVIAAAIVSIVGGQPIPFQGLAKIPGCSFALMGHQTHIELRSLVSGFRDLLHLFSRSPVTSLFELLNRDFERSSEARP